MKIGPAIRHRLGRFETPAAELYRSVFFDVDAFGDAVRALVPSAGRVLEIGCGDGSVADRITRAYPTAAYVGIDIAPSPGRRFRGDRTRVQFKCISSGDLLAGHPEPFDLVLIVDVLHHVPRQELRTQIIRDAIAMLSAHGTILVKDWARDRSAAYLIGYLADRYVSGDKTVRYMTRQELLELAGEAAPNMVVSEQASIRPHRTNMLVAVRRPD
jgi:2-polyprenyl-6-hydroxyphenyl methylase/3-demethylubiquinone-9 3-methyltransferase